MNVPGSTEGNWRWRCTESMLSGPAFGWLCEITKASSRASELARKAVNAGDQAHYEPSPLPVS
jgi:hypothetical protein